MVGSGKLALIVSLVALMVALTGNATTLYVGQRADAHLCADSQENRDKIREQISSGDPNLLKPGDPGYEYYRAHPVERDNLAKAIEKSLNRFPAIVCE